MHAYWDELIRAALVGTDNHPPQPPQPNGTLTQLLQRIPTEQPDSARVLTAASLITVAERAAPLPPEMPDRHDDFGTAPPDTTPELTAPQLATLDDIVVQHVNTAPERQTLFSYWLEHALKSGRRIPHRSLPDALSLLVELVQKDPITEPLDTLLGQRGRWLGSAYGKWMLTDYAENMPHATGVPAALRTAQFRQFRQENPAAAREFIMERMRRWNEKTLAAMIKQFYVGLSMDDEPLLESLLDSGKPKLHSAGVAMLSRLPDSAYSHRMRDHIRKHMRVRNGHSDFIIDQPKFETLDAAMQRDGFGKNDEKNWQQIFEGVPLDFWCEHFEREPAELIRMANQPLHFGTTSAWNTAIELRKVMHYAPNPRWSHAFIQYGLLNNLTEPLQAGLHPLSIAEKERLFIGWLNDNTAAQVIGKNKRAMSLMHLIPTHHWSAALTEAFLDWVQARAEHLIGANNRRGEAYFSQLRIRDICINNTHPAYLQESTALLDEVSQVSGRYYRLDNAKEVMVIRHNIWEAFQPDN